MVLMDDLGGKIPIIFGSTPIPRVVGFGESNLQIKDDLETTSQVKPQNLLRGLHSYTPYFLNITGFFLHGC